jgi:hypothetical protein
VKTTSKISHHSPLNPHVAARPQLRPVLTRHHSDQGDSFHRQGQGRPSMRRHHSAPRVPLAHARPAPAAVDVIEAVVTAAPAAPCAALVGVAVGTRSTRFVTRFWDVTLTFAEWLVDLLIDVAMERVGRGLRPGKSPSGLKLCGS